MMQMVASFAEFERAMLKERTQAGLAAARKEGRIGGRRPALKAEQQAEIVKLVTSDTKTAANAARLFNVHPSTVCRLLRRAMIAEHPKHSKNRPVMNAVTLYHVDLSRNMRRYYPIDVQPGIFGYSLLVRECGASGTQGNYAQCPSPPSMNPMLHFSPTSAPRRNEDTHPSVPADRRAFPVIAGRTQMHAENFQFFSRNSLVLPSPPG
jgi:hypothetical protein